MFLVSGLINSAAYIQESVVFIESWRVYELWSSKVRTSGELRTVTWGYFKLAVDGQ